MKSSFNKTNKGRSGWGGGEGWFKTFFENEKLF